MCASAGKTALHNHACRWCRWTGVHGHHVSRCSGCWFVVVVLAKEIEEPTIGSHLGVSAGRLIIVDNDVVDTSNLHRQVVHQTSSAGRPKAVSAREAALEINPGLDCVAVCERFAGDNAEALVSSCDIVVDATDNLAARYLINDACVLLRKPLVSGAAIGFDGQVRSRCSVYPPPPPVSSLSPFSLCASAAHGLQLQGWSMLSMHQPQASPSSRWLL